MDKLLALACFFMGVAFVIVAFPDGNVALLLITVATIIAVLLIRYLAPDDSLVLSRLFLVALLARLAFGLAIHVFNLRDFFGGDAYTYDNYGNVLMDSWFNPRFDWVDMTVLEYRTQGVGWGMLYIVAGVYSVIGRNVLAVQSLCGVIGAGIAPLVYVCSFKIFKNKRAAIIAAVLVAVYPAFIIWTGQLMKDGPIIFLLVLAVLMVQRLQEKFSFTSIVLLILALFGIVSLRFYIFYMMAIAVFASFFISRNTNPQILARKFLIMLVVVLALSYVGVARYAVAEFEKYGNLETLQNSREDLSRAESGFGEDVDISTVDGAIAVIPVGLAYLLLAPFPWQMTNLRQIITVPDMLIWWGSIPFMISGLIYAFRRKLLGSMGILIFTFMLSLAYAVFQGNVGTAYRQRAQIQVFLFIFVGVGVSLFLEKRENNQALKAAQRKRLEAKLLTHRERGERETRGLGDGETREKGDGE